MAWVSGKKRRREWITHWMEDVFAWESCFVYPQWPHLNGYTLAADCWTKHFHILWVRFRTNSTFENCRNYRNTVIHIKWDKSPEISWRRRRRKLDQVILTNKMAINNPWSNSKPKKKEFGTTIKYEPARKGQFERQTENQICTSARTHTHLYSDTAFPSMPWSMNRFRWHISFLRLFHLNIL